MRLFTRIVELGSFTAAADDLGLPRATATHTIKRLEQRLAVRLLERSTRHVRATADGEAYYQRCVQLLADLDEIEASLGSGVANPKGKLRVDLQPTLALRFLLPDLARFCARYPQIELEIGMGDRLVDLLREGVDCVVRGGEPKESSLVARRVAMLPQITCASAGYIAQRGRPRTLQELRGHSAVNYFPSAGSQPLPLEFMVDGQLQTRRLSGRIAVANTQAYVMCCEQGFGLIQVPRYHLEPQLAAGALVEVLPDFPPPPLPISVLYPHHRQLSPRVRVFIDWVVERVNFSG